MRSLEDLLTNSFWGFIRILTEDFIRRSSEDLLSIFDHLQKFFEFFLNKKLKERQEDLSKISKRFMKKLFEDPPKKINEDL